MKTITRTGYNTYLVGLCLFGMVVIGQSAICGGSAAYTRKVYTTDPVDYNNTDLYKTLVKIDPITHEETEIYTGHEIIGDVQPSPTGKLIAVQLYNESLSYYAIMNSEGGSVKHVPVPVYSIAFNPDETLVAFATGDPPSEDSEVGFLPTGIGIFDLNAEVINWIIEPHSGDPKNLGEVLWASDGKLYVQAYAWLSILDTASSSVTSLGIMSDCGGNVLQLSPDGRYILRGPPCDKIAVFDLEGIKPAVMDQSVESQIPIFEEGYRKLVDPRINRWDFRWVGSTGHYLALDGTDLRATKDNPNHFLRIIDVSNGETVFEEINGNTAVSFWLKHWKVGPASDLVLIDNVLTVGIQELIVSGKKDK